MVGFCHLEGQDVLLRATSRPQIRLVFCLLARVSLASFDLIPLLAEFRQLAFSKCFVLFAAWVLCLTLVLNVRPLATGRAYL